MTDAEKMREAAAQWCADEADRCEDAAKWGGHRKYVQDCKAAAYALRNAWSKILALPVPVDASAPAADCQQAELVTVDAGLLDEVKAALRAAFQGPYILAAVAIISISRMTTSSRLKLRILMLASMTSRTKTSPAALSIRESPFRHSAGQTT